MDYQLVFTGAVFAIANTLLQMFPWSFAFILLRYVNVCIYRVTEREKVLRIQKRITNSCYYTDDDKAFGYAVGLWYVLFLSAENDIYAWVVTTPKCFAALILPRNESVVRPLLGAPGLNAVNDLDFLTVYRRLGNYNNIWYRSATIEFKAVEPYATQLNIIEKIEAHFAAFKHTVAYIKGQPGVGKTMIGKILAQRLKGAYCNSLKPWQPGDTLDELYNEAEPSKVNPLVVAFDEVDGVIDMINKNLIPLHKNIPVSVRDKTGWNALFDMIDDGMYPYLVIVLTANESGQKNTNDPSLLRIGRVNLKFTF